MRIGGKKLQNALYMLPWHGQTKALDPFYTEFQELQAQLFEGGVKTKHFAEIGPACAQKFS